MYLLFCAAYMGVLFILQLLVGNVGVYLPLCALGVFYLSVSGSWRKAVFVALLAGAALDSLYGRSLMLSPFTFVLTALYGQFWIRHYNSKQLAESIVPGVLIPVITLVPLWLYRFYSSGLNLFQIKSALTMFIFTCTFGAVFMPLLVIILDNAAGMFRLPKYTEAKKRLLENRR
ncbi:hypothetical protein P0136_06230 [Lentisphaerota bacterium ZTH]|nr:hypothetical protein JYG24_02660 [Lentisphaerota bacterium]WET07587.1 hypothetical protein P0136_06230 [Lentisphaerota bacterium ZTH]